MSLTVRLKNIGILKQAEFSLGDLTIICGKNNTGKTYATYALYGFLQSWRRFIHIPIGDDQVRSLLTDGSLKIKLTQYVKRIDQMLADASEWYPKELDGIFASPENTFQNSEFHLQIEKNNDLHDQEINGRIGLPREGNFEYSKHKGSEILTINVVVEKEQERIDPDFARIVIRLVVMNLIFSNIFPNPFISSSERTGVLIFRKELDFARTRLLEEMGGADQNVDPRELLLKSYQNYPLPVRDNVDFTRQLANVAGSESFITKEHPEILKDFADIIGGEYTITQNDQLYYTPKDTKLKLTMDQSSSAVRSLLDIGFYLRCVVKKGDLLMVDEPELSLHPENQRRIARLFARLVNVSVQVFITTHSDYIVKELNTLIMLNRDKPHLKRIAKENGYQDSELINTDEIKVYVAQKASILLEEGHTFVRAEIHPRFGIKVPSFDSSIDAMNRIQDDIVWGEE